MTVLQHLPGRPYGTRSVRAHRELERCFTAIAGWNISLQPSSVVWEVRE